MADVFLSYARRSEGSVKLVASRLRRRGFSVWFDEQLPAHRTYSDVIEEELERASAVLVLWSAEAVRSQWVRSEANRARETGRLVQARLDEARLPMPFDQIQCADLRRWHGGEDDLGWASVLAGVEALAGREPRDVIACPPAAQPRPARLKRRQLLLGAAAIAAMGGGGFVAWQAGEQPELSPQARLLLQKGMDALQNNDALSPQDLGSTQQAIALLTDATEAAPHSATAWGALALAYAVRKRVAAVSDRPGLDARSRAAAANALRLDDREARALGALRLLEPVYRNWLAAERGNREALAKNRDVPILLFIMSDMLGNVGRWRDAAHFSKQFDRRSFLIPGADRKVVIDLWASGDLPGADQALEVAIEHWPQHPQIWRTRVGYLLFSGRPAEALELLRSDAERPAEIAVDFVSTVRATAEALAGRHAADEAVHENLAYAREYPSSALQVAQACVALGADEAALDLLEGYYFGEGPWAALAPTAGDLDRFTASLFQPPMRDLWRQPRFARILERTGLELYWSQSRTQPDFRRFAPQTPPAAT